MSFFKGRGQNCVVPARLKIVSFDVHGAQLLIRYFDSCRIARCIQNGFNSQACFCFGIGDEIDDGLVTGQWLQRSPKLISLCSPKVITSQTQISGWIFLVKLDIFYILSIWFFGLDSFPLFLSWRAPRLPLSYCAKEHWQDIG